jgi:hypothetical protein
MTQEQKDFFNKVIKPKLISMTIDCSLPSDMTELQDYHFEEEAEAYNDSEAVKRDEMLFNLSHYIASDDLDEALRLLEEVEDDSISADCIVTMWEPLEGRYTVSELLDLI